MARIVLVLSTALLVVGCAAEQVYDVPPAEVGGQPPAETAAGGDVTQKSADTDATRPGLVRLAVPPRSTGAPPKQDLSTRFPANNSLTVAADAMPLKDFLHYVFGELLKVSYVIAEGIPGLDQPVTLNVQTPLSSRALYKLVAELLTSPAADSIFRKSLATSWRNGSPGLSWNTPTRIDLVAVNLLMN